MTVEDLLRQIQPDLSTIAALFALLLLFLRLFWIFLTYEKSIREENIIRLQELLSNQKDVLITEPLEKELQKNLEFGYRYAVSKLYHIEFNPLSKKMEKTVIQNNEEIVKKMAELKTDDLFKEMSADRLSSKTGDDLFLFLEKRYQKTTLFISKYQKTKFFCRVTWAACVFLAILCALGVGLVINSNVPLFYLWMFLFVETLIIGIVSFTGLFYFRYRLTNDWERLKIYGEQ